MNLESFTSSRKGAWAELERGITLAKGRPKRLGAPGVLRFGRLYREVSADLALARRRWPGDPVVARLEHLVGRARPLVYGRERGAGGVGSFFASGYWRHIKERPILLALAALLLFGPGILSFLWALNDPAAAVGVLPEEYQQVADVGPGERSLSAAQQTLFATEVFTNNIQVSFLAFAGGAPAGLMTGFVLLYNGLTLGAVMGLVAGAGKGQVIVDFVVAHGVLELSCIVVAAAAGLRVGAALVNPGPRPRSEVFVEEARSGVEIAFGTVPWLVLAGIVEGYVSPRDLGIAEPILGVSLGLAFWALVIARGTPAPPAESAPAPAPSAVRALSL